MRILLSIILTLMVSVPAWATLTANVIPVAKTGGSTPALQNSDVTDVPGISLTSAVVTYVPQLCLNNVCETAWPAGGSQTTGSSLLAGNGSGGYTNVTAVSPMSYSAGNLSYVAPYIKCSETESSGTTGQSPTTANTWITLILNTKDSDTASIATLSSNQISLPAGTYRIYARASLSDFPGQTRLYNVTDSAVLLIGSSVYQYYEGGSPYYNMDSIVEGIITLTGTKSIAFQGYQSGSNAEPWGRPVGIGTEVYSVIEITKIS